MKPFLYSAVLCLAACHSTAVAGVDPTLEFSTYLGGDGRESAVGVGTGPNGEVYVLGNTAFGALDTGNLSLIRHVPPLPPGLPPGFIIPTDPDVMLIKYAADLRTIEYFAVIGGTGREEAVALRVDGQGNAVVLMRTDSIDFPTRNPIEANLQGDADFAIAKISPDGQDVIFSTYLGVGGGFPGFNILGRANIALDDTGQVYVCGTTFSTDFAVTPGTFQVQPGANTPNGFVAKLAADGSGPIYATYLGGDGADECHAIAVDSKGNVYLAGTTTSTDFPLVEPLNAARGPDISGRAPAPLFLAKLNAAGNILEFSTFLIGEGEVYALAVAPQGSVVVAGQTGGGLTTTVNSWQRATVGGFVLEFDPTRNVVAYSTHLGGTPFGLATDPAGNVAVAGATTPGSLCTTHAGFVSDNPLNQSSEAFVFKLDSSRHVSFSVLLGGLDADEGHGVAFLPGGDLALVGFTQSFDFPLANPAREFPVSDEAFVARISEKPSSGSGSPETVTRQYQDRDSASLPARFYRAHELRP